jgi:hypothetical protein
MDESERLWQHALHEDTLFNERLNVFLVMQGILLAVVGVVLQRPGIDTHPIARIIAGAAVVLTLLWWRVQVRQRKKVDTIVEELKTPFPKLATLLEATKPPKWLPASNSSILAHGFPVTLLVVWTVILWIA